MFWSCSGDSGFEVVTEEMWGWDGLTRYQDSRENLADKEYFGQIFQSGTADAVSATASNPRTWGFELGYQLLSR